jgi:hypothetical protein
MRAPIALAVGLVLAGCLAPAGVYHGAAGTADPPVDTLGWEGGYWYDERPSVTPEDGFNDSELDAVVARTMARVERIRGLEFRRSVPVSVISRAEFRERRGSNRSAQYSDWQNQLWEGLFVVDESTNATTARHAVFAGSVVGFYSPGGEKIVLVADDTDAVRVDRATLAHELVHALQDQHLRLGFRRTTMDGRTAATGLVEGDANYVMRRYEQRCGTQWNCVERPARSPGNGYNRGLFVALFHPYSDGPTFVAALRERGGWAAVDAAYENPPTSSEQLIHPERYPRGDPVAVTVADRSGPQWTPFAPADGQSPSTTVGEAAIFAMLWANGVVPEAELPEDDPLSTYDYDHPASAGWEGDVFVPYRNGDRFGYVFRTVWASPDDAREFLAAYRSVLEQHGARDLGDGVYRIREGERYADAFRVVRNGSTVTVVNAPTVGTLDRVHDRRD